MLARCSSTLLLLVLGCSSEEAHPPRFGSDAGAVENARSCKEARSGKPSGTDLLVDGEIAACMGTDIECSLADVTAFDGICKVGAPVATCKSDRWQIQCADLDASSDAPNE